MLCACLFSIHFFFLVFLKKKSCSACKSLVAGLGVPNIQLTARFLPWLYHFPGGAGQSEPGSNKGPQPQPLGGPSNVSIQIDSHPWPWEVDTAALPGLWKPHRSRIPIQGRPVCYPSESQSGGRGRPHLFQKIRRFISKNRNVRAVSPHVPNYLVPDCFLIQSVSLEVADSFIFQMDQQITDFRRYHWSKLS